MKNLDYQYIANLVVKAQSGSSDAFAELYAATYQHLYRFAYEYLGNEYLAQDALQQIYIRALQEIHILNDPNLFLSQLNQIGYRVCFNLLKKQSDSSSDPENEIVTIDGNAYTVRRIMNLPFTESQVLLMKYYDHMKNGNIARLLNISRSSVRRYLNRGRRRLKQILNM